MAELVECARLEIVYTGDRIEGSNPPISAINLPAQSGGLIYGGIGRFRNISRTKFGGRVRKQVDFGSVNAPKSSRFPRSRGTQRVTDERIPRRSQDSGIYTGTDKKLAVLRDFSCVDLCLGEKCPFLCHNIPLSIQSPFSDSQWSEKNKKIPPIRAVVC